MKTTHLAIGFAIGTAVCSLQAQQPSMPNMPGMPMSTHQSEPHQSEPHQAAPSQTPSRTQQPADAMPEDMKSMGQDSGNYPATAAASSVQTSVDQQAGQGTMKPGAGSDAKSITVPFQALQEPEAVGFQTGSDLPAPELLREVVDRQSMTLETFLDLAEKANPPLAQAQRNIERSNQQARQVGLPPDPSIGYSGDHIRGGSYQGGEQGAFFSQEFVLGRKLALRRDVYRAEGRSNEFALEMQRARVRNDVAREFFDTLAAQEAVVVYDRLLKVALDGETNAHELERVGQADASAVLTAEVGAEQAKVDFVNAQRSFLANFTQLATYAGQATLAPRPLSGALVQPPEIDAEGLVVSDMQESPAVKRAQADVAVAEARITSAKSERIPNLTVKAGEWYSGESLGATNVKAGWESFAEAGVQLPLWNRNQGNIQAAKIESDRAHQDVARVQLWTRNQAEPYAQQYQTARFTAQRYRTEMLPRARRAYQLEAMKYQQMAQVYPQVLMTQHMLFTLQLGYIQALDTEWRAAIALQNYTLMNGLDQPISTGQDTTSMNLPTGGSQ